MFYKLIIATIWFLAFSSISIAMDINNLTNADRKVLQKEIRRYILENPDIIFEAADIASDPTITRLLVALFNFMQAKEYAGQERAWGRYWFRRNSFRCSPL